MGDYTAEELSIHHLKIDKNVPRRSRYPHGEFAKIAMQMEIGDSVFCVDARVVNGLTMALNKLGRKIETRKEGDGRRLWRID